jgi:sugar/nucleoside kinase (ribokinase family)
MDITIPDGDIDVLTVGETLVDFISEQDTEWLREAATFRRHLGGSPTNISVYVAKLGGAAAIAAKTGIGAFGTFLKDELRAAGVNTDYLVMDHRVHTTVVFVSRTTGTPEFEAFRDGDFKLEPYDVRPEAVRRSRVVHASTFALSRVPCRYAVEKAFERAEEYGKIISLDPNYSPRVWPQTEEARSVLSAMLGHATISKPSLDDCHRFFGDEVDPRTYLERFHELGPKAVVLTMGKEGILVSDEGRVTEVPVRPVEVVDATGAGDSFWAGFLTALLDGNDLERCALFARSVVERKLQTVGHIPGKIDRAEVYAEIDAL